MHLRHSSLAIAMMLAAASAGIAAAENPALTIYRADGDTLFENGGTSTEGYAIVHEQRALKLTGGQQALVVDGLPATLDPEAVSLDLGAGTRVLAQRVLSTGDGDYRFCVFESEADVRALAPDFGALRKLGVRVIATAARSRRNAVRRSRSRFVRAAWK